MCEERILGVLDLGRPGWKGETSRLKVSIGNSWGGGQLRTPKEDEIPLSKDGGGRAGGVKEPLPVSLDTSSVSTAGLPCRSLQLLPSSGQCCPVAWE